MPPAVSVRGLRNVQAGFVNADREIRLGFRVGLRQVAEPVASTAEQLAASTIRRIGPRWSRMRIGITRTLVYVAPRERGTRRRERSSRPNLAPLLMDRAMQPALDRHESEIVRGFEALLDHMADNFNRGGAL